MARPAALSNNIIRGIGSFGGPPIQILNQSKSKIDTNPFIPDEQKISEIQYLQQNADKIVDEAFKKHKEASIANLTLNDINKNTVSSIQGFIDDLFKKPSEESWSSYLFKILDKDQRYAYFGVVFIFIAFYLLLVKN